MTNEITIPILPCGSIDETLDFYVAMGFEITYQQTRPNVYGCVRRGGIELHFFTLRDYDPMQSYSTCYVSAPDVDALYRTFAAGLRQHYGKIPVAGIPRITKPRNNTGDRRFNVIDPGGNWIRIGQPIETQDEKPNMGASTKLSRAIVAADFLTNTKGEYDAAAKILDTALAHDHADSSVHRLRALVLRAELAITLGDSQLARSLLTTVRQMPLGDDERSALADELERAGDLEQMLS